MGLPEPDNMEFDGEDLWFRRTQEEKLRCIPPENYDPNNFTYEAYRGLIEHALEQGYAFRSLTDESPPPKKSIVLRHEVPFSLEAAVRMAKIDHDLGVDSSFSIDPENPFYDLNGDARDPETGENRPAVQILQDLGREITLKITPRDEDGKLLSKPEIVEKIKRLRGEMKEELGIEIAAYSFDTTGTNPEEDLPLHEIDGMISVIGNQFADGISRTYAADQNGMYLYTSPRENMDEGKPHLHLMLHPQWSSETPMLPYQRLLALPEVQRNKNYLDNVTLARVRETGRVYPGDGGLPEFDAHLEAMIHEQTAPAPGFEPEP